jgi:hypothetical protein
MDISKIIKINIFTATATYTLLLTFFIIGISNTIDKILIISFVKCFGFLLAPILFGLLIYIIDKRRRFRFFAKWPIYVSPLLGAPPIISFANMTDPLGINSTFSLIIFFIYYFLIFSLFAIIIDFKIKKDNKDIKKLKSTER